MCDVRCSVPRRSVPRGPRTCCCCCVVSRRVPLSSSHDGSRGRPPSRRLGGTTTITMASYGQPRDDDDDDDDCGNETITIFTITLGPLSLARSRRREPSREDPADSEILRRPLSHSRYAPSFTLRPPSLVSFSSFLTLLLSFSPRLGTPRIHLSRGFV